MKEIQQQQMQQYKFEEFEQHVNLYNIIPAGDRKSLDLLRSITDGIQSGYFDKTPSVLIVGDGSMALAIAFANTICSDDIRQCDAKCFMGTREMIYFYGDSRFDSVHIIGNIDKMSSDNIVWNFIKHRVYKFSLSFDGRLSEYVYLNGHLILTATDITKVSQPIVDAVDFKIILEPYTDEQLEMLVQQRLKFCGIGYDTEVIPTILEYFYGGLKGIIDMLRICVLLVSQEGKDCLTLELVEKARAMAFLSLES